MPFPTPTSAQLLEMLGPQRSADPPLLRRVRLHQSWYRAVVLGRPKWGAVSSRRGTPLGSILTLDDAEAGLNFVSPEARHAYEARRHTGWGVDPVRCKQYLTSSQALTLNVLGPLFADTVWSAKTFGHVLNRSITDASRGSIEFAPRERLQLMGDRTIADAYVELRGDSERLGLVVETKYADGFGARDLGAAYRPSYLALDNRMQIWNRTAPEFGTGKFDQLARVHALGSTTFGAPANLLVLHHPSDARTPQIVAAYRRSLLDPNLVTTIDLSRFLLAMGTEADRAPQRGVVDALRLRYLDHQLSEPSWQAWVDLLRSPTRIQSRHLPED